MSLMTLLEQAQGGGLYSAVARSLDLDEAETRKAMRKLCPAIAAQLQEKAAADDELFQSLLDLIEDGAEASPLEDAEALTGAEAMADGNAILDDIYGSRNEAMVALREADGTSPSASCEARADLRHRGGGGTRPGQPPHGACRRAARRPDRRAARHHRGADQRHRRRHRRRR